jgi:hypothetical protein
MQQVQTMGIRRSWKLFITTLALIQTKSDLKNVGPGATYRGKRQYEEHLYLKKILYTSDLQDILIPQLAAARDQLLSAAHKHY